MHVDYGFVAMPFRDENKDGGKPPDGLLWYNLIYILVVNLILTAIISGIIIDTFAGMREKAEDIREDDNTYCFICNIERERFEREGLDFVEHTTKDHPME